MKGEFKMKSTIYKVVFFDASHRLLHYVGKCNCLHGHRWKVEVWIEGDINEKTKIVVDYCIIKKLIEKFDHQVILNKDDPMVMCLEKFQKPVTTIGDPTSELLAFTIKKMLNNEPEMKSNHAKIQKIRVWESPTCYAEIGE